MMCLSINHSTGAYTLSSSIPVLYTTGSSESGLVNIFLHLSLNLCTSMRYCQGRMKRREHVTKWTGAYV